VANNFVSSTTQSLARQYFSALACISDTISVLALHPVRDTTLLLHLFNYQQGKPFWILMKQQMMG